MSKRIVTFGEIMLRLKAPGHEKAAAVTLFGGDVWWRGGQCSYLIGPAGTGCDFRDGASL